MYSENYIFRVINRVDLYPTFLTFAGATNPAHPLDHADLSPLIVDPQTQLASREIFWYFPWYSSFHRPRVVVRCGDWKLIHLFESGENEFYNTKHDIGEATNVAAEHPELVSALDARIAAWIDDVNAPRMTPNPEYDSTPPATTNR
ncbi:hypothetical protein Poly41_14540 [Novipirellula artificiosorum]|uniref:N-sulphoglucosamine sulphohydrolase C-terminal domain-containing protein n=2 Tax=Novipirellula artificiosorum TaxID=2528016 RepID=A0A5C6DVA1_9BACT|nr:hypothetical protein Poly41_14540 [Novipirellula artificiosorum]